MKYIYISLFILSSLDLFSQGIQVSPVKVFFNLNPGETKTQSVNVENQSTENKLFEISLSDWYRDSLGDKVYSPIGTLPNSCSEWIILRPNILELKANENKNIQIVMNRPINNSTENNKAKCSMLFIKEIKEKESLLKPIENMESRMLIEYRLGVHIYHNPTSNNLKNIDISSFKINSKNKKSKKEDNILEITLDNNGTELSESIIKVILTNTLNGEEIKLANVSVSMMPETKRIIKIIPITYSKCGAKTNVSTNKKMVKNPIHKYHAGRPSR